MACKEGVATHSAGRVLEGEEASVETEEDWAVATPAVVTPAAETEIPEAIANAR